ncbi:hypothetical protein CKO51_25795 [Rhodopirellula sp. SM50]|nr:glycosyltransferase family 2 protein [Rhodopirellula sp. SM50]PAY16592.1 hypothetical protein CKO51_25795 [Rhodopirellula sp. SM50]
MKLSLYTCVRNGIYYDYHVVEMVKHHLPLVDELVIFDGNSTDGTRKALQGLGPKVKLFSADWGDPQGEEWFAGFKNIARQRCRGDWCILLDPDEFIPEWEFDRLRQTIETTTFPIIQLDWIHFYGNYRVYNARPSRMKWAEYKYQVHQNLPEMRVWGDGSNVRLDDLEYEQTVAPERFVCHHFGIVRWPSRLRQKLRVVGQIKQGTLRWLNLPGFIFNLLPYNWLDEDFLPDLAIYDGKLIEPVRRNPKEFTRDGMKLHRYLLKKAQELQEH